MIYLDYAADYPVRIETLEALVESEKDYRGNMNSLHTLGEKAHERYEVLMKELLDLLSLPQEEYEVIFTSSATESNNLAIKGVYESYSGYGNKLLMSEFEHNSVNASMSYLKNKGADVSFVHTKKDGKMDLEELKEECQKGVLLTSLALVESEVGTIQDYQGAQKIVHESQNGFLLLDATQAMGKLNLDLKDIDLISFTPHKYGGLKGTGFLIKKKSIILTPLIHGGKSGSPYRSGTEPLSLLESSLTATRIALEEREEHYHKVEALSSYLRNGLKEIPEVEINSPIGNPYIVNFSIDGIPGAKSVEALNEKGFAVSQKSACSIPNTPSKAVMAMYHDRKRALSSLRVSLSSKTKQYELELFLDALKEVIHEFK